MEQENFKKKGMEEYLESSNEVLISDFEETFGNKCLVEILFSVNCDDGCSENHKGYIVTGFQYSKGKFIICWQNKYIVISQNISLLDYSDESDCGCYELFLQPEDDFDCYEIILD